MRSTLFHLPEKIAGWPLFGFGLLLAAWIAFSLGMIIWIGRRQGWGVATFANLPVYLLVAAGIALIIPRLSEPGYGLPIRSYGLTVLIGVVAGVGLAVRRAPSGNRRGLCFLTCLLAVCCRHHRGAAVVHQQL